VKSDAAAEVVRLGDATIAPGFHACGLFDGPDDLYDQLAPFIRDGIARGDRAVHILAESAKAAHLARLAELGIDVAAATARDQLVVVGWEDFYPVGGRFEPIGTVRILLATLDGGGRQGFAATRLIGFMEWALEDTPGTEWVGEYEALLDAELRRPADMVVCAYDARRHRAGTIVDVLAVHSFALVEGRLRNRPTPVGPRGRIIATANRLFHRHGIVATGVDRIITEAGVAKATFYRQFGSKEELVLTWIEDPATRWFDPILERSRLDPASPEAVVRTLFEGAASWLELDEFRGCPYTNAIAELGAVDPANRIRVAAVRALDELRAAVRSAVGNPGADAATGDAVHALLIGAMQVAVADRSTEPIRVAKDAALALIETRRGLGAG
jgi:AcrR family transcriptional regulator